MGEVAARPARAFLLVVTVCALAGLDDLNSWLVVLVVMSALTVVFEALLVRNGPRAWWSAPAPWCAGPAGAPLR